MSETGAKEPPRNGEGDHAKHGGGVFATSRPTIERARQERRSGNLPEVILWRVLKTRPGGHKFRRQHPLGPYVLDFACLSARIAIEIDGEAHNRSSQPEHDKKRDSQLNAVGFAVLRFPASVVLRDVDAVVRAITAACAAQPLHRPMDGPPPRPGEVFVEETIP